MQKDENLSTYIARQLLTINAITLRPKEPFTWSSGLKSPIYCDNRLTMSYPAVRKKIAEGFVNIIKEHYPSVEVIAGTATAGIPHAAWVAELMALPMIYVRDKPKGHGKQNLIEGVLPLNKKVVVIEDLLSTGGSSISAADAVKEAGGEALGVVAIFTYQLPIASRKFTDHKLDYHTLSCYEDMIQVALEMGEIGIEDVDMMKKWRENPEQYASN